MRPLRNRCPPARRGREFAPRSRPRCGSRRFGPSVGTTPCGCPRRVHLPPPRENPCTSGAEPARRAIIATGGSRTAPTKSRVPWLSFAHFARRGRSGTPRPTNQTDNRQVVVPHCQNGRLASRPYGNTKPASPPNDGRDAYMRPLRVNRAIRPRRDRTTPRGCPSLHSYPAAARKSRRDRSRPVPAYRGRNPREGRSSQRAAPGRGLPYEIRAPSRAAILYAAGAILYTGASIVRKAARPAASPNEASPAAAASGREPKTFQGEERG